MNFPFGFSHASRFLSKYNTPCGAVSSFSKNTSYIFLYLMMNTVIGTLITNPVLAFEKIDVTQDFHQFQEYQDYNNSENDSENFDPNNKFNLNPITYFRTKSNIKNFKSTLPLASIHTNNQSIERSNEIDASFIIINNELGTNTTDEMYRTYLETGINDNDNILIRRRGQSSDSFPQKQYQIEFINKDPNSSEANEKLNIPLLGMANDSKWVLHAPYHDKSLMRNALTFKVARKLTDTQGKNWYAPRTKFLELFINDEYKGVYTVIEKIDPHPLKVSIGELNQNAPLQADYILKADPLSDNDEHFKTNGGITLTYHYPKKKKLDKWKQKSPENHQLFLNRVENELNKFEETLENVNDPEFYQKISKLIDIQSFINFILIQEVFKNIDGYRRSVYLYSKNGLIHAGPIWDFNLALGNLWFYSQYKTSGWQHNRHYIDGNNEIFWFKSLLKNKKFAAKLVQTYFKLRTEGQAFHSEEIKNDIDQLTLEIGDSHKRHFTKWNLLGSPIFPFWPSPPPWPITYAGEISKLKKWMTNRLQWMDENMLNLLKEN